jgi:uncharacterized membrane protein
MSRQRSLIASYGIALLFVNGCDDGSGPMRSVSTSAVEASPAPDNGESTEQAEDEREVPAEVEAPVEPETPDEIGLPCAVKMVLAAHCQGCHGVDAKNGTPLLNRDNLVTVSKKDPTVTVIERALLRVTATEKPMPPLGKGEAPSQEEQKILRDWVEHGSQPGRCDVL